MGVYSKTIREVLKDINAERDGGVFLPYIQRDFVWKENKIYELLDSIMRGYPIGTFLAWETREILDYRPFTDKYTSTLNFDALIRRPDSQSFKRIYILDGQQRLQSLYLISQGTFLGKNLYFNIASDPHSDGGYEFEFLKAKDGSNWPWVPFCDVIGQVNAGQVFALLKKDFPNQIATHVLQRIQQNITRAIQVFDTEKILTFQTPENSSSLDLDQISQIFVRANSGGMVLEKADLMMARIKTVWTDASSVLAEINETLSDMDFKRTKDFVLQSFFLLLGKGGKYTAAKLSAPTMKAMEQAYPEISASILDVMSLISTFSFLGGSKDLAYWDPVYPLVAFRHFHFDRTRWAGAVNLEQFLHPIREYLLYAYLSEAFIKTPPAMLDELCAEIKQDHGLYFNADLVQNVCRRHKRSLNPDYKKLMQERYKSTRCNMLLYFLYYYNPNKDSLSGPLDVDHIFPKGLFKTAKNKNIDGRQVNAADWDRLANLELLPYTANRGMGAMPPLNKFSLLDTAALTHHMIPSCGTCHKKASCPDHGTTMNSCLAHRRFFDFLENREALLMAVLQDNISRFA